MTCWFRVVSVLSVLVMGGLAALQAPPPRASIVVTCHTWVPDFRPALNFAWQTEHASAVQVESGYLDAQGEFVPGSWHVAEELPPQGSGSFLMKINNYAVRVCITAPEAATDPVCAVCVAEN